MGFKDVLVHNLCSVRIICTIQLAVFASCNIFNGYSDNHHSSDGECECPGDILTYECTVMRGAGTIWTGSAFDCPRSSNELYILEFSTDVRMCNNGTITANVISVEENNYTSQLKVSFISEIIGKTIECSYTDGISVTILIFSVIDRTGPLSPPDKLQISNINFLLQELTFSWSPVAPDCPAIHYNILALNCGSCPTTTNHTTVTCTEIPTDGSVCTFAVQTVVCGNITGNASDQIRVNISSLHPAESLNIHNLASNTVFIISTSSLATALIISEVASIIVIIVILKWRKTKAAPDLRQISGAVGHTHMESMYEDVTGPTPSVSAINIQDNVAYGHTET